MTWNIENQISTELHIKPAAVEAVIGLLAGGYKIPFIARYRKEQTGGLDEETIRRIRNGHTYLTALEKRRKEIESQIHKKLTEEDKERLYSITHLEELEDFFLPFNPKRSTTSKESENKGLTPLAEQLLQGKIEGSLLDFAMPHVNPEKGLPSVGAVIAGISDIIADRVACDLEGRRRIRQLVWNEGEIHASPTPKAEKNREAANFKDYFSFKEKIRELPPHRVLAVFRGERLKILKLTILIPKEKGLEYFRSRYLHDAVSKLPEIEKLLKSIVDDSFNRLLVPAVVKETKHRLKTWADDKSIELFSKNLRQLLLSPSLGQKAVMGISPGYRTGCRLAVVDAKGEFLEAATVFPHPPFQKRDDATNILLALLQKHRPEVISIGSGVAARETLSFVELCISMTPMKIHTSLTNEAGIAAYTASEISQKEFPDLEPADRGAVSLARRLQDPLLELVKIEPQNIGIGQYQHDVNPAKLTSKLSEEVQSCVNLVGVNINTASSSLLKYVSGLSPEQVTKILDERGLRGGFKTRHELKKITSIDEDTYTQAIGFLRIPEGSNPLDSSAIHPDTYSLVDKITETLGKDISEVIRNSELIDTLKVKDLVDDRFKEPTIIHVLKELRNPGRDPRGQYQFFELKEGIKEIEDLKAGMTLTGRVTNITDFGVFLDIGIRQDGLIHKSELAHQFVDDPTIAASIGAIMEVKVVEVDLARKRINLSRKALIEAPKKRTKPGSDKSRSDQRAQGGRPGRASKGVRGRNERDDRGKRGKVGGADKRRVPPKSKPKKEVHYSMDDLMKKFKT